MGAACRRVRGKRWREKGGGDQLTRVIAGDQEFADLIIAEIKSWSEEDKAEAREVLYRWADAKEGTN